MIKVIYKLFLGVLLATTIGMGIATFYPGPERPEYPRDNPAVMSGSQPDPGQTEAQRQYERDYEAYDAKQKDYGRNVAVIAVILSIVVLALGLTVLSKMDIIADGLVLGGIFTLLYGIIRSFGSEESKFIFLTTLVGLITALVLGYVKFIRPAAPAPARKTAAKKKKQ